MNEPRSLSLTFTTPDLREDISVVLQTGDNLWVASDETAQIERLTRLETGGYGDHVSFKLAELGILPSPNEDQEVDIEGLAFCEPYLWLVGSHSLKRMKPDSGKSDPDQAIVQLAGIKREANRYLLARIPLTRGEDGQWRPERAAADAHAAALPATGKGSDLTKLLRKDPHIAPFLTIPAKENGFDVEGLAVDGNRVFLGLRGPVLRGWAIILELLIGEKDGALRLKKIGADKQRYRKHFVDLGGLGIRELCLDGNDMLILAGPTMDLDGPVSIFRWRDALGVTGPSLVAQDGLAKLCDLPYGAGCDHAEGLSLYDDGSGAAKLLVVYDAPAAVRKIGDGVRADLLPLAPLPEKAAAKPEKAAKASRPRRPVKAKA